MTTFDLANILFAGPCNQHCPYCIGRQLDPALNHPNLSEFPLRGLADFVTLLKKHGIQELTFTGVNTDPQLYEYEFELLCWLYAEIPHLHISLHTNGQLALRKIDVLNRYHRATLSFPSFNPDTFYRMTGVRSMPPLTEIVGQSRIPLKISCVLTPDNQGEMEEFLLGCRNLGIRRVVFRQCQGNPLPWRPPAMLRPAGEYRRNPVYCWEGIQVTFWQFDRTTCTSLNLFSDGRISDRYRLVG